MLFVIHEEQDAIRHADTKLGLLLTAESLVAARLFPGRDVFLDPGQGLDGVRHVLTVVTYYGACLALVVSVGALVFGLVPRRFLPAPHDREAAAGSSGPAVPPLNRFAWPMVAEATVSEMYGLTDDSLRAEAIEQAMVLARIARTKFQLFDRSLWAAMTCVLLSVTWALLRA